MNKYLEKIASDGVFKRYVSNLLGEPEIPFRKEVKELRGHKAHAENRIHQTTEFIRALEPHSEYAHNVKELEHVRRGYYPLLEEAQHRLTAIEPKWKEARKSVFRARAGTAGAIGVGTLAAYAIHKHRKEHE